MMNRLIVLLVLAAIAGAGAAQAPPPDDKPSIKLGGTIFADYTWIDSPATTDADGNRINANSFSVTRAYLNVTGQIHHRIAFRITPDIARESGSGSSLSGSQTFRLKYAYGQFNLDDWTTRGSWIRLGMQQTPYIDYEESLYRYRFQGPIFVDREGFLSSSDNGLSARWTFPSDFGDVHGGFYNGEGYNRSETNDQKAFMIRGSVRPLPRSALWKGLRLTAFYDGDHYVQDAKRQRLVANIAFEHALFNACVGWLDAEDRGSARVSAVDATGYSAWIIPKLPGGFELLLRRDELKPNRSTEQKRTRHIFGVAYWMPQRSGITSAILLDYDSLRQSGFSTDRPDDTRYGLKVLLNF